MGVINEEMLRRRAEHNEGILHSLEELVLQEEGIMEINRNLGAFCPNLKILYLPNNLIGKLSNLYRLKQLHYLNVAVNNIQKIEGLEQCEFLEKLDMTLNFVGKKELPSVSSLKANIHLRDLFLTGNPCQEVPGYRSYVIATLPRLKRLDGVEIRPSERIVAQQEYEHVFGNGDESVDDDEAAPETGAVDENGDIVREYTPASRLAEYAELERKKNEKSSNRKEQQKPPARRTGFDPLPAEGRIYQKNEGNWSFKLTESECGSKIILDVPIGRYMETSLMDIDIQPLLVRVLIKGKLLQLRLPEEVKTSESIAQRSRVSGHLVVTMPKAVVKKHRQQHKDTYILKAGKEPQKPQKPHVKFSDIENIIRPSNKPVVDEARICSGGIRRVDEETLPGDSDEVPPLE